MSWLLVLGAQSAMASAIAHEFAGNGFNIYLAARDLQECDKSAKDLEIRYSVKAQALKFDVLQYDGHPTFYDNLDEKPSVVVCVVGYLGNQETAEHDFIETRKIIDTNYVGCVSILSVIANDFEKRGQGCIIAVGSVAGDRGRKSNYIYGSAKAAFSAYLSGLRNRLFKSGVHVMTVKPGFVRTRMTEGLDLPDILTAKPEEVAKDIFRAWQKNKDVIYTKWFWRYIMMAIKSIPERYFKKMEL